MMFMVVFLTGLAAGLATQSAGALSNLKFTQAVLSTDAKGVLAESSISSEQIDDLLSQSVGSVAPFSFERAALKTSQEADKIDVAYLVLEPENFLLDYELIDEPRIDEERAVILSESFKDLGIRLGDDLIDVKSQLILRVVGFIPTESYAFSPIAIISNQTYTSLQQAINPTYQESYQAVALKEQDMNLDSEELELLSQSDLVGKVPGYAAQQLTINLISGVLLFVSAAILGIFFYILTLQKRQQFGIMKAVGISLKEIILMQFSQGLLLAVTGVVLGNLLAFGTILVLPAAVPVTVNYVLAFLASISFVLMAALSILFSCWQVSKIDPVMIIGGGEV